MDMVGAITGEGSGTTATSTTSTPFLGTRAPGTSYAQTGQQPVPASARNETGEKPRRHRMPAEKRRQQLLSMAGIVFSRKGYKGTTMEDIALLAGVTKPILYQHFQSKKSLYKELVTEASSTLIDAIATATAGATSPKEQVELGFGAFFSLLVTAMDTFRLLLMSDMQDDKDLSRALRNVEDSIASIIYNLIDIGLDEGHRILLAKAVVGMGKSVSRHWVEIYSYSDPPPPPSKDEAAQMARHLADLVWAGLRAVHAD
ncbi:MAG: TetR/AcrR family transcriptional regulator [Acidimicrobiales bacterium]